MITDPIATRYASALFEQAKAAGQIEPVAKDLETLAHLIREHEELRQFLLNPDVEASDKLGVVDRLFKTAWSDDVKTFVRMVLALDRAAWLVQMAEAFRGLVDAEQGVVRVVVRSAHPLSSTMKTKIKQRLEQLEARKVELTEEQAPELIGGIQVLVDHRMVDGSLKGKLVELRQRLKSVRVH